MKVIQNAAPIEMLLFDRIPIYSLIFLAGLGQIALALGSLAIPKILNWKSGLSKVQPLIKQLFWTYAAYILVTNFCFGLVSVFATNALLDGSVLATAVTGFIAFYWLSRIVIQFVYFERGSFPKGKLLVLGEALLVALFIFLTLVYGWSFYLNLKA